MSLRFFSATLRRLENIIKVQERILRVALAQSEIESTQTTREGTAEGRRPLRLHLRSSR